MPREWASRNPKVAQTLVASYVRAINWMRQSRAHVTTAAGWVLAEGTAFTGEPAKLPLEKTVDIAYKYLLDVPGAPSIPSLVDGVAPLLREFHFLQEQGIIASNASEDMLRAGFAYDGLKRVQSDPRTHRLFRFDYDQ